MGRSRIPRSGVMRLRNDPGTIAKQLAVTMVGLFAVVTALTAMILMHGDEIDADIDKEAALGLHDEPDEPAPESGESMPESGLPALPGNLTAS